MPSNFGFHVWAEKSVFIGENGNAFFGGDSSIRSTDIRVHRAGSQLKTLLFNQYRISCPGSLKNLFSKDYDKREAPPMINAINIDINLDINTILRLDEKEEEIVLEVTLTHKWKDDR